METKTQNPTNAERLVPLLRSIAREVKERTEAIQFLEARVESFQKSPHIHAEDLRLTEATLAIERRELRHVHEELGRLGCELDEDNPQRILVAGEGQAFTFTWQLDDTQFHRRTPVDSIA